MIWLNVIITCLRVRAAIVTVNTETHCFHVNFAMRLPTNYRCIRELAPELSEKFPTICEFNSYFFELELISKVSDRFLR